MGAPNLLLAPGDIMLPPLHLRLHVKSNCWAVSNLNVKISISKNQRGNNHVVFLRDYKLIFCAALLCFLQSCN